jgi:hypothetical protein
MSGFSANFVRNRQNLNGKTSGQFIDTLANWQNSNPILNAGQIAIESDTGRLKWGDSRTAWNDLAYKTNLPSEGFQLYRSGKDANGIFTVLTYRRSNNLIYKTITLSGGISPLYALRTIRYFAEDGETITSAIYFELNYQDEELVSETFLGESSIVTDGLILNLDAGNSASYSGIGTTWYDLSGNNYNGTLINGISYDSANGGSLVFDGIDDYVLGTVDGSIFAGDFTQSAWIKKTNADQNWQGVFSNSYLGAVLTYVMTFGNGSIAAPFNSVGTNQLGTIEDGIFLDVGNHLNKWINIIIKKTGSTLTIYCYIDGTLLQTSETINWNNGNFSTTNNYLVGAHWENFQDTTPLQGNISQVLLYNRALTQQEITQNYNAVKDRYQ